MLEVVELITLINEINILNWKLFANINNNSMVPYSPALVNSNQY